MLNVIEKYYILWYYFNMEYKLIRSLRKTLAIKITPNGEIIVLSPKKCSLQYINNFLIEKQNWIKKTREMQLQKSNRLETYQCLEKIFLFGKECKIIDNISHYQIDGYYIKHTKSNNKEKIIKQFYTKLANEYICQRTYELSNKLQLPYKDIKIISARKKWGSCNNLKQLRFNFRLIMLPKFLIDYVICHELCHTQYLNHGKEFWLMLEKLGYKKTAIKQNFQEYNFVLELL